MTDDTYTDYTHLVTTTVRHADEPAPPEYQIREWIARSLERLRFSSLVVEPVRIKPELAIADYTRVPVGTLRRIIADLPDEAALAINRETGDVHLDITAALKESTK